MKNLRVADIPHQEPAFWLRVFLNGRFNRAGRNFFWEILKNRTEEDSLREWEKTDVPEADWRKMNEIVLSNGIFSESFIFPDDELAVFCGHWMKRTSDNMETEDFLWQCETFFERRLPENFDWWKPNLTFLEFYRFLQTLPKGLPTRNKRRWGCCAVMLAYLLVPSLAATWYGFQTGGIWNALWTFFLVFNVAITSLLLLSWLWIEAETFFCSVFRSKKQK